MKWTVILAVLVLWSHVVCAACMNPEDINGKKVTWCPGMHHTPEPIVVTNSTVTCDRTTVVGSYTQGLILRGTVHLKYCTLAQFTEAIVATEYSNVTFDDVVVRNSVTGVQRHEFAYLSDNITFENVDYSEVIVEKKSTEEGLLPVQPDIVASPKPIQRIFLAVPRTYNEHTLPDVYADTHEIVRSIDVVEKTAYVNSTHTRVVTTLHAHIPRDDVVIIEDLRGLATSDTGPYLTFSLSDLEPKTHYTLSYVLNASLPDIDEMSPVTIPLEPTHNIWNTYLLLAGILILGSLYLVRLISSS